MRSAVEVDLERVSIPFASGKGSGQEKDTLRRRFLAGLNPLRVGEGVRTGVQFKMVIGASAVSIPIASGKGSGPPTPIVLRG